MLSTELERVPPRYVARHRRRSWLTRALRHGLAAVRGTQ